MLASPFLLHFHRLINLDVGLPALRLGQPAQLTAGTCALVRQ